MNSPQYLQQRLKLISAQKGSGECSGVDVVESAAERDPERRPGDIHPPFFHLFFEEKSGGVSFERGVQGK